MLDMFERAQSAYWIDRIVPKGQMREIRLVDGGPAIRESILKWLTFDVDTMNTAAQIARTKQVEIRIDPASQRLRSNPQSPRGDRAHTE